MNNNESVGSVCTLMNRKNIQKRTRLRVSSFYLGGGSHRLDPLGSRCWDRLKNARSLLEGSTHKRRRAEAGLGRWQCQSEKSLPTQQEPEQGVSSTVAPCWGEMTSLEGQYFAQPLAEATLRRAGMDHEAVNWSVLSSWWGIRAAQLHFCHRGHEVWGGGGNWVTFTFLALDFVLGDCICILKLQIEGQIVFYLAHICDSSHF